MTTGFGSGARATRADAVMNRERLLAAAAVEFRTRGDSVPMVEIAARAGVGVGTLYRHFPSRDALHAALTHRAFTVVRDRVRAIAALDVTALEAIARFFDETIEHRNDLVLPLHGGPAELSDAALALQSEIRAALGEILDRGRADGSIRPDLTPRDIVIAGAQLAQPLAHVDDWDRMARRQAELLLGGLGPQRG